jgi:multidrug efflux pump subunit AcrA (membrane-fusion protein)
MFTEDYLMRIINQATAALMIALGLRKAGKYSEAQQAIQQAIEQLITLPANLVDQMDDGAILGMLAAQGQLDLGRLAILADIYQEQGEILIMQDQPIQGGAAFTRSLRFILEVVLAEDNNLSAENIGKVTNLAQRLEGSFLPVETQLALTDYYLRLLEKDDQLLIAAGTSRAHVSQALANLQGPSGPEINLKGD